MGGVGSGRTAQKWRDYCHNSAPISIAALVKAGAFGQDFTAPGIGGYFTDLESDGRAQTLVLSWLMFRQTVEIVYTDCTKGGNRPWFSCPGCERRAGVLYLLHGSFQCRKCHRLPYRSQHQSADRRALAKAIQIRQRLGQTAATIWAPFPERPSRMHLYTYSRLRYEALSAELEHLQGVSVRYGLPPLSLP